MSACATYITSLLMCSETKLLIELKASFIILCNIAGRLLIADTNNNSIRYLDLNEKEPALQTLDLKGVLPPSPRPKALKRLRRRLSADTYIIKVDGGSSADGNLSLRISLPPGYHFSKVWLEIFLHDVSSFVIVLEDWASS